MDVAGTISGALLTISGPGSSYMQGGLGIGTKSFGSQLAVSGSMIISSKGSSGAIMADSGVTLEVVGSISGSSLFINGSGSTALLMTKQSTGK